MAYLPQQPGKAGIRKVNHSRFQQSKRRWGGNGASWPICKSFALCSRQTATKASHWSNFLQARCSFWLTNSIKAARLIIWKLQH